MGACKKYTIQRSQRVRVVVLEGDWNRYLSGQSGSCIGRCYYQAGKEKRVYEDKTLEKENGSVVSVNLKRGRAVKRSTRSIRYCGCSDRQRSPSTIEVDHLERSKSAVPIAISIWNLLDCEQLLLSFPAILRRICS